MNVIEIQSVSKSFRYGFWGTRKRVLRSLSLDLRQGEVFGFLGHNGAGKTTTMKLILGLSRPDAGRVLMFGSEGVNPRKQARIGYLSEELGLYPHLTSVETLRLVGELYRIPRGELAPRIDELIKTVGLETGRSQKIRHYSKGQRQRLGIAVALINDPEVLLLDEPYSGLDPIGRKELRQLLLSLKTEGKTILLSSHIVPDVEAVCDRVGILSGGRVTQTLDMNELYMKRDDDVEVTISGPNSVMDIEQRTGVESVVSRHDLTIVRCKGAERLKDLISDVYAANGTVLEVKPMRMNLEDIFVRATNESREPAPAEEREEQPVLAES